MAVIKFIRYLLIAATMLCSSSNDAFTNQHSLIPPSFGGPQIHVTLPRVPSISASELTATVSCDSQSTTQTVTSSEYIIEMGHDVVKDLLVDGVSKQQPDDLMSVAEESSISAAGAGFDAALRRVSAPEAAEMCNEQQCIDMKYVDAPVTVEDSSSHPNGHTACSMAWHLLNPGLSKASSDSSIASSVGSLLEGSSMDISGLVCRTAAVAGQSSFKTYALTDRSSDVTDVIDDSSSGLTDKTEMQDDDDGGSGGGGDISAVHNVSEHSIVAHSDNAMQEHCVK